jgi:hypothetical protein
MLKFIRINLNIGLFTLIWGDTVIQSRHFVQIFIEILKNRVFCVLCQPLFKITYKESLYSRSSEFILNTVSYPIVPYRTVPYRFPFSVRIFITLAISKREAYRTFCLKFSILPLKKSKAGGEPYLKLKTVKSVI